MSSEDHWIRTLISEAQTDHPLVTEAVSSRMAVELKGQLCEQQLSQMDLTSLATELVAQMVPKPLKKDAKH